MSLDRFAEAQAPVWPHVLSQLRDGRKSSHWMWFVFPQLVSLGRSDMAKYFGIADLAEAQDYVAHPVLGPRLQEAADAVLLHPDLSATAIMGETDAMKLRSSMTLFERAAPDCHLFPRLIDTFYSGERCHATLAEIGPG